MSRNCAATSLTRCKLSETDIQNIETAALLHNIGKIGLPDRLLDTPYMELPHADRAEFDRHPRRAAAALMALDPLLQAAKLIRYHREHYDGVGNSSGLRGESLPLGARILLVASDYDALQQGLISRDKLITGAGARHDRQRQQYALRPDRGGRIPRTDVARRQQVPMSRPNFW